MAIKVCSYHAIFITMSAALTLKWLRQRPTLTWFKLSPTDVDAARNKRIAWIQIGSLASLALLVPAAAADLFLDMRLFAAAGVPPMVIFAAIAAFNWSIKSSATRPPWCPLPK